jgi:hypothetical protein
MKKNRPCLPMQKEPKSAGKLLSSNGGELNEMMMGSVIAKMREGGNAKRVASKADGTEQLQSYKIGGWTHS